MNEKVCVMQLRENEKKEGHIRFNSYYISLIAKMLDSMSSTIDIMYFLMERREERAFVAMLVSAKEIDMYALIEREKRDTDIMFELDAEENLYTLICQDTKIDGGYHFAERLLRKMSEAGGKEIYCTELEVRSTGYKTSYIVYRLMELFVKAKENKMEREVVFKALN
jgi:hypothetical protein